MDKTVILHDFASRAKEITVKDLEKAVFALLQIVSGDMLLEVFYLDGHTEEFDALPDGEWRCGGYFDGSTCVPLDKLDKLGEFQNSYAALDYFDKLPPEKRKPVHVFEAESGVEAYAPNVCLESNDGKTYYRATFAEFPDMLGGIGPSVAEALTAAYSMLDAEISFRKEKGLPVPEPRVLPLVEGGE